MKRKIFLSLVFLAAFPPVFFSSQVFAASWMPSGAGSGGAIGSGGGGTCSANANNRKWMIDCTGVSWIFYKATRSVNQSTSINNQVQSGYRIQNPQAVPAECSKHEGGGFWHFGKNYFNSCYDSDGNNVSATYCPVTSYGHDKLYDWRRYTDVEWITYRTAPPSGVSWGSKKQSFGVYQLDHYGSVNEVLKQYNAARKYNNQSTVSTLPAGAYAFCYWPGMEDAGNPIEGKSTVGDKTTDWTKVDKTAQTYFINDCSPTSGCKVTFNHQLKRNSGTSSTNYTINRESNLWHSEKNLGVMPRVLKDNSTESFQASPTTVQNEELTLLPGMVVCESMTFNNGAKTSNLATTKVCAAALGNAQPNDPDPDGSEDPNSPSGDTSFINIKVRNASVNNQYSNYQRTVYAKPGDEVNFRAVYNPVLQYTYYLAPQKVQIDGGAILPRNEINRTLQLGLYYNNFLINSNEYKDKGLYNWNNAFSIQKSTNDRDYALISNANYEGGDTTKRQELNSHTVSNDDTGKSITEEAITNLNESTKTTPSQVSFTNNSGNNLGNIITAVKSQRAAALVPYNFNNSTEVLSGSGTLPAGEKTTISYTYQVGTKPNSATDGTYATRVDSAKWKLQICEGSCSDSNTTKYETTEESGVANASSNANGATDTKTASINVPDVRAGTQLCVRSMIYPATSGADTNLDKEGDRTWAYSTTEQCFQIAKKPSLQIWGGNVYSRGKITTSVSEKINLEGITPFSADSTTNPQKYVFGSFGELGVIAGAGVSGFASGAATGFAENNSGDLWPAIHPADGLGNNANLNGRAPGGSVEVSGTLCDNRSPLTFANHPCGSGGAVGTIGNSIAMNSASNDKSSVINKFVSGGETNVSGSISINNDSPAYSYSGGSDLTITGADLSATGAKNIKAVRSDRNITIDGNLIYSGRFTSLANIPKLIVYAENIYINCGVERIDALLIANNTVVTCNNLGSATSSTSIRSYEARATDHINDAMNSNQLIINGAVISDSIVPNRTYGAATGANSIIPAEIINYDPSLYLWGGEDTNILGGGNSSLNVTYLHEVSPRY